MRTSMALAAPGARRCLALFAALASTAILLPACRDPAPAPAAALQPLRESHPNSPLSAEACADDWLGRHRLNEYGDPPGTIYPGATPLFDERTGARTERLDYLFAHHADLRADCAPGRRAEAPGPGQAH